ncbi:Aste57867_20292 [Aphanomyces stellatus]|uniref:Aste57867_20292 protein n=1 Tax=Aphanomyces stellatus TaxID=120398 RepID=A0A485LEM5_9STRA|nr:hypothetical protein As57867_020226 [Aphanomyces stellatus]VFT96982.1 Aste57867_20292 [Aphanomyces stellatus]
MLDSLRRLFPFLFCRAASATARGSMTKASPATATVWASCIRVFGKKRRPSDEPPLVLETPPYAASSAWLVTLAVLVAKQKELEAATAAADTDHANTQATVADDDDDDDDELDGSRASAEWL